jgi:hypothetical protein
MWCLRNANRWFGENAEHGCTAAISRQTCTPDDAVSLDEQRRKEKPPAVSCRGFFWKSSDDQDQKLR